VSVTKNMTLKSNIRDYEVTFQDNIDFLNDLTCLPNVVFVVDQNVWSLHGSSTLKSITNPIILPISEEGKSLASVEFLYDQVLTLAAKKNMTIVSIGGGITQDITGFMASTLYRGIKWVFLPTTLLAQADSCIGAKTSLNYKKYKNLLGSFYPPHAVHIYTGFLSTLKELDYFSGLGEMVKLALIGGQAASEATISRLEQVIQKQPDMVLDEIQAALSIKKSYIEDDEFDSGRRNILNYGHCFGHAIEFAVNYSIPHGQAVVIGMILANQVATRRGVLAASTAQDILTRLLLPVLKIDLKQQVFDVDLIIEGMKQDKKRVGEGFPLIMLQNNFAMVKVLDVSESEVRDVFLSLGELVNDQGQ
jgi:3-dehydroquinate synthase